MASPNRDNALKKGTTFTFGSWTCIADRLGGFTNHLNDQRSVEPNSTYHHPLNNAAASATGVEDPPEDIQEEENFDLINRYWTDPEEAASSQDLNPDPSAAVDQFSEKIAKCINLAQAILECSGC